MNKKCLLSLLLAMVFVCFLGFSVADEPENAIQCGDYDYVLLPDGTAEVVLYRGTEQDIVIPSEMDGHPVTSIGAMGMNVINRSAKYEPGTYLSVDEVLMLADVFAYPPLLTDPEECRSMVIEKYVPENERLEMIRFLAREYSWEQGWCVLPDLDVNNQPRDVEAFRADAMAWIQREIDAEQEAIATTQAQLDDPNTHPGKITALTKVIDSRKKKVEELESELAAVASIRYVLDSSVMEIWMEQTGLTASAENAPELISLWLEAYGPLISGDRVPEGFNNGMAFIVSDQGLRYGASELKTLEKIETKARIISQVTFSTESRYVRLEDIALTFTIPGPIHSVVIPDGVTRICTFAFDGMDELTDVVIPDSVTEIASYAFTNCRVLNNLVIPESVTSIGENAFPRLLIGPDGSNQPYTLIVVPGSYAESYCIESNIQFTYP